MSRLRGDSMMTAAFLKGIAEGLSGTVYFDAVFGLFWNLLRQEPTTIVIQWIVGR